MGLGIALEGFCSKRQACQVYDRALARGGLPDGVRACVRQRLQALAQRPCGDTAAATDTDGD
ncbi:MAG: hypothetical protein PHC98_04300, partial [Syntrophotalea acetylenica]|nr:hypothetical protein [Syntrophotalea acetylenica]